MTSWKIRYTLGLFAFLAATTLAVVADTRQPVDRGKPNIVFILADDMGYGDLRCYNGESKIPTPTIDRLAEHGMRFTNAHSTGTTCVPARYGLMTGRYPFRVDTRAVRERSLIEPGRMTVASLLKRYGYSTACVGKWHLGFDGWQRETTDHSQPMRGGPVDRGFDYFYGMHASLDIPPYFYIENDRPVMPPTQTIGASHSDDVRPIQGAFWREGKIAPGFRHAEVLGRFTEKSIEFIERHQKVDEEKPFFLYLALAAPHTPWLPTGPFRGSTPVGDYGDFVTEVDAAIGHILDTLERLEIADETVVFFSNDNGPVWFDDDTERHGHASTHPLRGRKGDAWEGGHRVPFIARWPGRIKAGSTSDETISFADMLSTLAALVGDALPENAGEDSFDMLPALLGEKLEKPIREATVVEDRAIIQGDWKLVMGPAEGFVTRRWVKGAQASSEKAGGVLYNLRDDPGEKTDLYLEKPERVESLRALMERYRKTGRSAPRS